MRDATGAPRRGFPNRTLAALIAYLSWGAVPLAHADDAARGKEVFKLCEGCHSMARNEHRFGPSLAGVVGRPAGKLRGYAFSEALAGVRFKWDATHLAQWLGDEAKNMVPGTRMEFPGISDPADVRALIAFMAKAR